MNDRRLDQIVAALNQGMSWAQLAELLGYADAESAYGSFRVMLRKRGLRMNRQTTVRVWLEPDPSPRLYRSRRRALS